MMLLASAVHSYFHLADEQTHSAGNYTFTTQTYFGAPMQLGAGHMIFTNPLHTPLKMPIGKYAILGFTGDIVDENHEPVPLDSAYDHHWIAKNDVHRNQLCNKGLEYVFGIGAESRNNPVNFPAGFGYLVESGVTWGANVHLLRTEGLAGDNPHKAAKECNEGAARAGFRGVAIKLTRWSGNRGRMRKIALGRALRAKGGAVLW